MQLRRVRVENIRSYEAAELEFSSGTTLLSGDVGSGKTSLLYAIEMALFGVAEVDAAYLVRHGATHAEVSVALDGPDREYEISRRFRRLRRKGRETFEAERIRFIANGAETSYSATELRQQVIDLLGFPDNPSPQAHSDLWRWAVYVPQERMRDILGARPQDRLETVRKALGVERYRTAAENAQLLASDLKRSAAAWRAEADRLKHFDAAFEEGSREADRLRGDRGNLDRALRSRESEVDVLRATRTDLESRVRKAEADERELGSLEREQEVDRASLAGQERAIQDQLASVTRRRAEYESARGEAELLNPRREALAQADRELALLRTEAERRSAQLRRLAEARAVLASAERRREETREALERWRVEEEGARKRNEEAIEEGPAKEPPAPTPDALPVIEQRVAESRERESTALHALAQAEGSLTEVEELLRAGVCPRCHQPVRPSEYSAHRVEAEAAVTAARATLHAVEVERTRSEEERASRERYERAFDRWKEAESRRELSRSALERAVRSREEAVRAQEAADASLIAARARVDELSPEEERESSLREAVARAEQSRTARTEEVERSVLAEERCRGVEHALELLKAESARREQDVALLHVRLDERAERLSNLNLGMQRVPETRSALVEAERSLREAEGAVADEKAALVRLDAKLDEAVRRAAEAEVGRREREKLLAEALEAEEKAGWVGQSFRLAVLTMEQSLLTHAQTLFERDFARFFASLVDDPGLVARTDPAFTPLVMIEGEWTPAEALSGGERTSLALAFRLALARVVRAMGSLRLDTILLDEPTDGFSPEQVIRMGELLEELALPQVIIVSHESELAAIADRVVRVEKVGGRSFLTPTDPQSHLR